MELWQELNLHGQALLGAVESDKKFFASIYHYVQKLVAMSTGKAGPPSKLELGAVMAKIEEFFSKWRPSEVGFYISPRQADDANPIVVELNRVVDKLTKLGDSEFAELAPYTVRNGSQHRSQQVQPCIFIGHGRSRLWARVKMFLEDELKLATVSYESESRTGESIVSILETMLDQSTFAVLILTAEDETTEDKKRARQNVVHEAGLFQGRLGFKRAVLLIQEGVETFTNVDGLQHIPFAGDNVEQSFYELRRVLKREEQIQL